MQKIKLSKEEYFILTDSILNTDEAYLIIDHDLKKAKCEIKWDENHSTYNAVSYYRIKNIYNKLETIN